MELASGRRRPAKGVAFAGSGPRVGGAGGILFGGWAAFRCNEVLAMRIFARWMLAGVAMAGGVVSAQAADGLGHREDRMPFEIAGFGGWTTGGEFKLQGGGAISNGQVTGTGSRS